MPTALDVTETDTVTYPDSCEPPWPPVEAPPPLEAVAPPDDWPPPEEAPPDVLVVSAAPVF